MDIAFILNSAIVETTGWLARECVCKHTETASYRLSSGLLLSVNGRKKNHRRERQGALKLSELLVPIVGGKAAETPKVSLVPSLRTRFRKALSSVACGFELPLRRGFALSGCFALVAALSLGLAQPVRAESIPVCADKVSHLVGLGNNGQLLARPDSTPPNHVFRLGSKFRGLDRNTYTVGSEINSEQKTKTVNGKTTKVWEYHSNTDMPVRRDDVNPSYGRSGHINMTHGDFLY